MSLPEFLGDDFRRSFRIEKAIAQDLADDLAGAAIIGFGAGLFGLQGGEAAFLVGGQDLIITLATITIFLSGRADLGFQTLAFKDHEEAAGQVVGGGDGQGACRAGELPGLGVELERGVHAGKVARSGRCV